MYSRFGFALAALDFNRDGVDDLVVTAPVYGLGGSSNISDASLVYRNAKTWNGRFYVYLGKKG